jgi:hypothetical protein
MLKQKQTYSSKSVVHVESELEIVPLGHLDLHAYRLVQNSIIDSQGDYIIRVDIPKSSTTEGIAHLSDIEKFINSGEGYSTKSNIDGRIDSSYWAFLPMSERKSVFNYDNFRQAVVDNPFTAFTGGKVSKDDLVTYSGGYFFDINLKPLPQPIVLDASGMYTERFYDLEKLINILGKRKDIKFYDIMGREIAHADEDAIFYSDGEDTIFAHWHPSASDMELIWEECCLILPPKEGKKQIDTTPYFRMHEAILNRDLLGLRRKGARWSL